MRQARPGWARRCHYRHGHRSSGGTFAVIMMTFFGPLMASYAVTFSPSDYVALMVFAFACLASLVGIEPGEDAAWAR